MTEKVLPYDHAIVPQEKPWDCGPASAQVVLNSRNIIRTEDDLIRKIGTTVNGTNYVGLIERVLDVIVPDARYTSVEMRTDPPTQDQKDLLWRNIVQSIDGGFGVVMNWVAPPRNFPRGVKGSPTPEYRGGNTIYHYVACMGYDDNPAERALWIADSGFRPYGYWISFEQAATLIPDKAYAYADTGVAQEAPDTPDDQIIEALLRAMGGGVPFDRYRALLPAVAQSLEECQCNTVDRVAMWMAQVGHESGGLKYMEEIADGSAYQGRADLGNLQPGDGRRFKGRGPIQVTGRSNYTELSKWAHRQGKVPTPTFFVDEPEQLATDRYAFLGLVWYWTTQRPMNDFADHADIEGGSIAVNGRNKDTGRANGIEDRIARWNRCRAMGAALLTITTGVLTMPEAQEIKDATAGVAANGWPFDWRWAYSRHPRDFNQIVDDPSRGPWSRVMPDGSQHAGHTDAYEQIVPINEQIAWTHVFSDGIERDSGDVLLELMEFAIQWRQANDLPTSAFVEVNGAVVPRKRPAKKVPAKKAVKKAVAKKAPARLVHA
ncbi:C39 family peptidase [Mycobacterium sp. DSM 3803]|nr:C39 family peptidase [Mycobacterium sp. DSM 3803]